MAVGNQIGNMFWDFFQKWRSGIAGGQTGRGVSFQVSTGELRRKSADVQKQVANMKRQYNELSRLVEKTESYWTGSSGDAYRRRYRENKGRIDEILKLLDQYPKDLLQIARADEGTEQALGDEMQELPKDVIL